MTFFIVAIAVGSLLLVSDASIQIASKGAQGGKGKHPTCIPKIVRGLAEALPLLSFQLLRPHF
jgi:hypothetical protein